MTKDKIIIELYENLKAVHFTFRFEKSRDIVNNVLNICDKHCLKRKSTYCVRVGDIYYFVNKLGFQMCMRVCL